MHSGSPIGLAAFKGRRNNNNNNNNNNNIQNDPHSEKLNFWNSDVSLCSKAVLERVEALSSSSVPPKRARSKMAAAWPKETAWPLEYREHALHLAKYMQETNKCIDCSQDAPVPAALVKVITSSTMSLIAKVHRVADMSTVCDKLEIMQGEAKTATTGNAETLDTIRQELGSIRDIMQRAAATGEEARTAAKEATEVAKTAVGMVRDIKNKGSSGTLSAPVSYAAVAARGTLASSIHNKQNVGTMPAQVQREVIVNIRNPLTIQNLRAMNPRNLKAHIERAIAQSGSERIKNIRIMSSNQLKSGDLSIRTATSGETHALRETAGEWAGLVGNGASIRNPTYGVIAHGIRTSTMDMDKFESIRDGILLDNRPFIPNADIRYIGWLTRTAPNKAASSIIIEFSRPEDANKIIDEGLVWQGELFQCERYERQCRLKQCFNCQKYGHIGTQCKATTACGYCAQEHSSRDCPTKSEREKARKCAACHGGHEAWSQQCPTRKEELARTKAAYATRSQYHLVATSTLTVPNEETTARTATTLRRKRSAHDEGHHSHARSGPFLAARKNKRTHSGSMLVHTDKENDDTDAPSSQRPQRAHVPSRRALEALANNSINQQVAMDIESD